MENENTSKLKIQEHRLKLKLPFPYRISAIYILLGVVWILFSDNLVLSFTQNLYYIHRISLYKGWFYVITTGILLFYLVKSEINRRTELYRQLLVAKKKAEESDKLKTTFLSNLSHYIRTPMNSILGFAELLKDEKENQQLFLSYIHEQSNHLLFTINNIVDISKIQEGMYEIKPKPFSINEMLTSLYLAAQMEVMQKQKPIAIKLLLEQTKGKDKINSDGEKITQILSCIIDNAIIFTNKGEIEIGYSANNKEVIFKVKDTGKGIPQHEQASLFRSFLHQSTTNFKKDEGPRLSLYLSHGLAKLLGGHLWLESSNNMGSLFCLSIPNNQ